MSTTIGITAIGGTEGALAAGAGRGNRFATGGVAYTGVTFHWYGRATAALGMKFAVYDSSAGTPDAAAPTTRLWTGTDTQAVSSAAAWRTLDLSSLTIPTSVTHISLWYLPDSTNGRLNYATGSGYSETVTYASGWPDPFGSLADGTVTRDFSMYITVEPANTGGGGPSKSIQAAPFYYYL